MRDRKYELLQAFTFPLTLVIFGLLRLKMTSGLPKLFQAEGDLVEVRNVWLQVLDWHRILALGLSVIFFLALASFFRQRKSQPFFWVELGLWALALVVSLLNP